MKKGKLNIPSRATTPPATPTAATAAMQTAFNRPGASGQTMPTNFRPTPQAPAQNGKPPSVMIAVPAMEMVNAEFAQHLAMAAANMVANALRLVHVATANKRFPIRGMCCDPPPKGQFHDDA